MQKIFAAARLFTGTEWLLEHQVVLQDDKILQVSPRMPEASYYDQCMIVPAFIDLQVYGAGGRLLAEQPDAKTLQTMKEIFSAQGTQIFLPTVATNTIEVFRRCIDAVREYWKQEGKGVYGLHLEGPWLNPEKRGAHVEKWIHPPGMDEVNDLLNYGRGVIKMITLAPEVCSIEILNRILEDGIIVSAGHSNASQEEALAGFERGISAVTHLYNAMSPLHHRFPGLVGAAFRHQRACASIIPDGHHVDYGAVTIAKKIMGERLFAITDAVTETATGPYRHQLAGDKYECQGVLSGSALSMHQAFKNLVLHAGVELGEALRMCSLYPARVLSCDNRYGKIAPQYTGQFLVLNDQLDLVCVLNP
jgi:N-acetylglucosamine-6-phosphate deacetylase